MKDLLTRYEALSDIIMPIFGSITGIGRSDSYSLIGPVTGTDYYHFLTRTSNGQECLSPSLVIHAIHTNSIGSNK